MKFFRILKKSKKSKARAGVIQTTHGSIRTPAFVPVATRGTLKAVPPKDLKNIGVQAAFVNTFHLTVHPGVEVIKKFGGIHAYSNLDIPLMSDSAGFQVFSLGQGKARARVKARGAAPPERGDEAALVGIDEKGVRFRSPRDGRLMTFTPEFSMRNQEKIGADILMAFDECIYYGASYEYSKEATERTHQWLLRCVKAKKRKDPSARTEFGTGHRQFLYGIIQGGIFRDLRRESAKFVAGQNVDGVAIGGVSVGETKKELREQIRWTAPYLPQDKPVHLLGVGRVEDILYAVPYGIDTFDCAEPTRIARNGLVYQWPRRTRPENPTRSDLVDVGRFDLNKSRCGSDRNPIQKTCRCYTCKHFSLSYLHHLFKEKELLAYYLATYHNLYFFSELFRGIREDIRRGGV